MWEPGVVISLVVGVVAIVGQIISITVFVVKLGGKIDVNNSRLVGKIDVIDHRVKNVEASIIDLKNTDRRLSLVEDRQAALATRQGNMEQDNLLIREDLGKLHQGLDRHGSVMQRFNETQFSK
ncbi:hypothetical protein J4G43_022695 [Bradyrhizobium barranii subsp. barranii]|uniref:DUF2746 domain-containing protein n=1 Tax=Bradyrhizobium barranii subsp. barranii TaxID=2823807 RepID=A0A939M7H4_9BRAD|nr:hypothetical protein [Bradyrhizobium barranii]UEM16773.1 hypothetical protein J4G43_022695 [Bradyrhizobium barranii subsp. barranii]